MKKAILVLLVGLLLSGNAYARTKTSITIKDLKAQGYKYKGSITRRDYIYHLFENDKDFFECARDTTNMRSQYFCYHLSDGK
jgi:hypothetical protein|tara:strand:- start:505 stop:750 length:246 start_codon:yes stop_codon:yes gene_type:complete